MGCVLGVGIATLDIINLVDGYPAEDSEVRAVAQHIERGGNATNTLVVLSQLGQQCHWMGVLAQDPSSEIIGEQLSAYQIDFSACRRVTGVTPTSYIALNHHNGSRTIVHYRDLPELDFDHFAAFDLTRFDWLHVEGRAVDETAQMLAYARQTLPHIPRSVEIEKPRDGIEQLFKDADLLFFSRIYAEYCGYDDPRLFLQAMRERVGHADLVCTWGIKGAFGLSREGVMAESPAFLQPQVIDSIGAGDSFNAGFIDARMRNLDMQASLTFACRVAGVKCGQQGFAGLAQRLEAVADMENTNE